MRGKTILLSIVAAVLLFSLSPVSSYAGSSSKGVNDLSALDAFHPPDSDDSRILMYREWHYFNILADDQDLSFITTMTLMGISMTRQIALP
ncbi:MAG TPA: hypothetical protein HA257_09840 [Candidatus Methanoperedenaceae archaeon]|nr:hypothetical protein [Candidatus Methanoperedenaceae archaeon]